VADALSERVDAAAHLLQAGARGADQADRTLAHAIGESERDAADDRSTTVGTHDEQALVARHGLDHAFLFERDVVAEQEDMQPLAQRLQRLGGRIGPRHRDLCERGLAGVGPSHRDRPRHDRGGLTAACGRTFTLQQVGDFGDRRG
jgi:hypothetical protein